MHLGSFASRCITHIITDSCTSFMARASSGNGTGCKSAPSPGRQSAYSDLRRYFSNLKLGFKITEHANEENKLVYTMLTQCSRRAGSTATAATTAAYPRWMTRDSTLRTCEQNRWYCRKPGIVIFVCDNEWHLPVEYSRDADGHEIGKYPWMRTITTRPMNRRDVISDRLLAVVVFVQGRHEDLHTYVKQYYTLFVII